MKPSTRAVAIAAIHVLLICSLGLKLLHDRQSCPQAWFRTRQYDPNLPIRGRYVSLQVEVADPRPLNESVTRYRDEIRAQENTQAQTHWHGPVDFGRECGSIVVQRGLPLARFEPNGPSGLCDNLEFSRRRSADGSTTVLLLEEPVLFFIADTAEVPTRQRDSELWVLATVPRKGPPRPIALGIKKAGERAIERLNLN
jgi:hypothetical protein